MFFITLALPCYYSIKRHSLTDQLAVLKLNLFMSIQDLPANRSSHTVARHNDLESGSGFVRINYIVFLQHSSIPVVHNPYSTSSNRVGWGIYYLPDLCHTEAIV